MINRVVLTGRLTKDLELRYSPNGIAMLTFTLAVNRQFKQEGQPESDFILCKAFKKNAENMANHLSKGSLIGIEGRIQTGSYEGQDGKRVYTTDVMVDAFTFLESKATGQQNNMAQQQNLQQAANQATGYQQPPQQNYGQQQYTQQPQYSQQNFNQQPQQGYQQNQFNQNKGPVEISEDQLPF